MLTLTIPDMTCGGCVASVTKVVKALDSTAVIEADLPTKRVTIASVASVESLLAAIGRAGFHPEQG